MSQRRLLSAQVSGLQSSGHDSCDALFGGPAARVVSVPRERDFCTSQGGGTHPLPTVSTVASPRLLASLRPLFGTPSWNSREGETGEAERARWVSNSAELC